MQIEVTEKEAMEIYSKRYYDGLGKKRHVPIIILAIAVIVVMLIYAEGREWLSVAIFLIMIIPAFYLGIKTGRASGKYAKSQIEEQK